MIHYTGIHLISAAKLSYKPGPPQLQRRTEFVFPCRTVTKERTGDVTPAVNHCFSLDIGPAFARS